MESRGCRFHVQTDNDWAGVSNDEGGQASRVRDVVEGRGTARTAHTVAAGGLLDGVMKTGITLDVKRHGMQQPLLVGGIRRRTTGATGRAPGV